MEPARILSAAIVALAASGAAGQETGPVTDGAGQALYMENCATCHGTQGTGDGPLAELMTVPMPDLTQISAAHDGTFPMLETIMVIDGRTGIRGHGYPMPVWGDRFKAEVPTDDHAAEIDARGRVLSLALYLQSIQE